MKKYANIVTPELKLSDFGTDADGYLRPYETVTQIRVFTDDHPFGVAVLLKKYDDETFDLPQLLKDFVAADTEDDRLYLGEMLFHTIADDIGAWPNTISRDIAIHSDMSGNYCT